MSRWEKLEGLKEREKKNGDKINKSHVKRGKKVQRSDSVGDEGGRKAK